MVPLRRTTAGLLGAVVVVAAGCSSSSDEPIVPRRWVDAAVATWPDPAGRAAGGGTRCVFGQGSFSFMGHDVAWGTAGYAPAGDADAGDDTFVHQCVIDDSTGPLGFPATLKLLHSRSQDPLDEAVDDFDGLDDLLWNGFELDTVQSGRYSIRTAWRWLPTYPQAQYLALVEDTGQRTVLTLEVSQPDPQHTRPVQSREVAEALASLLDAGNRGG